MPITSFLGRERFDPETKRILGVAFEMTRAAIARPMEDATDGIIAKCIIELAKSGERNPDRLCEKALTILKSPRIDVIGWLRTDQRYISASIDRISKSANSLVKMQQRISASVALIERARSLKLPTLPKWIDTLPPQNGTFESKGTESND